MKILDFLKQLRESDVQLSIDGDNLRCSAPAGSLTDEVRREIRERKDEIVKFLRLAESLANTQRAVVPLQPQGKAIPIFAVAGHNGDVFCFRALARYLGDDQPFFGLQPPGLDGANEPLKSVEDLAAYFAAQIRTIRPDGPYVVAGYCAGGSIAFELARQLHQVGADVTHLALFGCPFPTYYRFLPQLRQNFGQLTERLTRHVRKLASLPAGELRQYVSERVRNYKTERSAASDAAQDPVLIRREKVGRATLAAIRRYLPGSFSGRVSIFSPSKETDGAAAAQWSSVAHDIENYFGPAGCNGALMLSDYYATTFAGLYKLSVQEASDKRTIPARQSPAPLTRLNVGAMRTSTHETG
jgi:thioesterase domain-containing protein